ncbi:MAG: family 78 glycoside hydrolase catalytic domain [Bdellovibrionaceae bacterium]|nr:family 78 glycoside hydrolase catalytic domain [Pseudobdellovibrionaceae bacterium]
MIEPNRKIETIAPVAITGTGPYKIDFGKNFSGWIEVTMTNGSSGQTVTFQMSDKSDLDMQYNMTGKYIFDGSGAGTYCNRFSLWSGRYLTISGLGYQPSASDVTAYSIGNDLTRGGHFDCSNELLNQIYDTTIWNYRVLTGGGQTVDCPHRERLGYGGDAHTSLELALNNFEMGAFFTKWARDWRDVQMASGDIEHTAPTKIGGGGPAWGGFAITMPYEVYFNLRRQTDIKRELPDHEGFR